MPFAPLLTRSVPVNNVLLIYRFGKFDRQADTGLRWAPPCYEPYQIFTGKDFIQHKHLNIMDKYGNPMIINSNVGYSVSDPRLYLEKTNFFDQLSIINSIIGVSLRDTLKNYPLISSDEDDILKSSVVTRHLVDNVQMNILPFGISVHDVNITEAKYAPEIANQMLAKQQARAYVEARNLIVKGALDTVNDVSKQLVGISPEAKEKLTVNLLTILAGNSHAQPTINV